MSTILSEEKIQEYTFSKHNIEGTWHQLIDKGYIDPFKKNDILELGTCIGSSCIWMSKHFALHSETVIDTVDPRSNKTERDKLILNTLEYFIQPYHNIVFHNTTSELFLKRATKKYDFIYIDGDHRFNTVLNDAISSYGILKDGGTMVFDDYDDPAWPGVTAAVDKFCEDTQIKDKFKLNIAQLVIRKTETTFSPEKDK